MVSLAPKFQTPGNKSLGLQESLRHKGAESRVLTILFFSEYVFIFYFLYFLPSYFRCFLRACISMILCYIYPTKGSLAVFITYLVFYCSGSVNKFIYSCPKFKFIKNLRIVRIQTILKNSKNHAITGIKWLLSHYNCFYLILQISRESYT